MPGPERVGAAVHDGRVLALPAAAGAHAVVVGRDAVALLDDLLQPSLVVLVLDRLRQRPEAVQVVVVGRVVPGVEEDGAQHRLEGVGEQRLQAAAAALGDALAQVQEVPEPELLAQGRQGVGVDHGGAQLRHLALAGARPQLEQVLRRDELEHRVAEVLEPLVVARRHVRTLVGERAVGQRLAQQGEVAERNPYLLLQLLEAPGRNLGIMDGTATAATRARLGYEPDFSCMYSQA